MAESFDAANRSDEPPLSLRRLRNAFAAMLSTSAPPGAPNNSVSEQSPSREEPAACPISPRSVTEAVLFVGRPDNAPISARELAATMRGVSPKEIDAAVAELNAAYEQDGGPYFIEQSPGGYRMALRQEFQRFRVKLLGKSREARLSPGALEVLSVVAYNQPVTGDDVARIRSRPSGSVLATLVRRRLLKLERSAEPGAPSTYVTTDRFLRLFNLKSLAELPRSEELELGGSEPPPPALAMGGRSSPG